MSRFRSPWRDLDKSIAHVVGEVRAYLQSHGERRTVERVEVIRPVFYQISRAYIVGRVIGRGLSRAARDRAQEHRQRRAGRCGDAGRGRRQHRVQLHALLLPRRPRARRGSRGVPEVDHAEEAGERAVHGARPCPPGQDRALPRADAQPRAHRGPLRARSRRARTRDGVLHAQLRRRRLQGHPRPLRVSEDRAARGGSREVPDGIHPRSRRAAGGCAGIQAAALSARALRPGTAGRNCAAKPPAPCTRMARTWSSTTCTSSGA